MDYHTHNQLNKHATGTSRDYIESALIKGLGEIGLSDHFPMHLLPESALVRGYAMEMEQYEPYLEEAKMLQKSYQGKIAVKIASEVDYFGPVFEQYKQQIHPYLSEFDYLIGSIHVISWLGVEPWGVDDEKFQYQFRRYGSDKIYQEYYDSILRMVKTGFYDVIGHLDLPKKFGNLPNHPDQIWDKVLHILDAIQQTGMVVEINTSGLLKPIKEQYPSEHILRECINRQIPITLGSDSHHPESVGYQFDTIITMVKKCGLTHLCLFNKREKNLSQI
jgi:histidinol-phosphatase (PHP family)